MSSPFDYSRLPYGPRFRFFNDGSIREDNNSDHVSMDSGDSPIQLRRPPPIGKFDKEPVVIPVGHPLAQKAFKGLPPLRLPQDVSASFHLEKKDLEGNSTLNTSMDKTQVEKEEDPEQKRQKFLEALDKLNTCFAATKDTLSNALPQEDGFDEVDAVLDGIQDKIVSENNLIQKFKSECDKELDHCTIPSKKVYTMKMKLNEAKEHKDELTNIARQIRLNFNTAYEIRQKCAGIENGLQFIKENTSEGSVENSKISSEISSSLFAVSKTLLPLPVLVHRLSKDSDPLGRLLADTMSLMLLVDSTFIKYFPAVPIEAVPPPTETTASISQMTSESASVESIPQTASTQDTHRIRLDSLSSASAASILSTSTFASTYKNDKVDEEENDVLTALSISDRAEVSVSM